MSLLSRRAYMSQLAPADCDICHELMAEPTWTSCRHCYCFECLRTWLGSGNNSCPTCRVQLFEETPEDFEEEEEVEVPIATAARVSRQNNIQRDVDELNLRVEALETAIARLSTAQTAALVVNGAPTEPGYQPRRPSWASSESSDVASVEPDHSSDSTTETSSTAEEGNQQQPTAETPDVPDNLDFDDSIEREHDISYHSILAFSNQLQAERRPLATARKIFDRFAMHRLLGRLSPQASALPEWYEEVRTRDVRYTLTTNNTTAQLEFVSFEIPSWVDQSRNEIGEHVSQMEFAYWDRQYGWKCKVEEHLGRQRASDLLREVHRLMEEETGNSLELLTYAL